MLKRLELIGFKSFADKTEFAFGPGLTAVVGPNGSGKSNVVDAVRWIMGEQSPKSLRGGEMTDVIFNGSATRKPLGMAEVSLTLDNSRRLLATNADEVEIARRVYRDGQGEYLINRQPARLKDIKDLFLGSGAGSDAYCIIAQGRVENLLHASNQERRAVFEEAAGISRFRAKKQETLKKLEQTEQNLARLQDIIDELKRQLAGVRQQATKALKFQELQAALKERRIALATQEGHGHAQLLVRLEAELAAAAAEEARDAAAADAADQAATALEETLAALDQQQREQEATLADLKAGLAAALSHHEHETKRAASLAQEIAQADTRRAELADKAEGGAALEKAAAIEAAETATRAEAAAAAAAQAWEQLLELNARIRSARDAAEGHKAALLDEMRQAARAHNDAVSLRGQRQNLEQHEARLAARHRQNEQAQALATGDLATVEAADAGVRQELAGARTALDALRGEIDARRHEAQEGRAALAADREARSGLASQLQLLRDLEANRDGGLPPALALLDQARNEPAGPWGSLLGCVGDVLHVDPDHAALFDLALGDKADWLLIQNLAALQAAASAAAASSSLPSGRVTFLPIDQIASDGQLSAADLPRDCAPASSYVSCEASFGPALVQFLFGDLLLARDLDQALELRAAHPRHRFLTCDGDLASADGVVTLGPSAAGLGRLARKSRLAELETEAARLDAKLASAEEDLQAIEARLAELQSRQPTLEQSAAGLTQQAADLGFRLAQQRERAQQLADEVSLGEAEIRQLGEELAKLREALEAAERAAAAADQQVRHRQDQIAAGEAELQSLDKGRGELQEAVTAAKVAAAQAEERRVAADSRLRQAQTERRRRDEELDQHIRRAATLADEEAGAAAELRRLAEQIAAHEAGRAAAEAALAGLADEIGRRRAERQELLKTQQGLRERRLAQQQRRHALEMKQNETQLQLTGLASRLQEEHEADLMALLPGFVPADPPLDAAAVQEEIAELRKKIARLGSVNLDALAELSELETRSSSLAQQHADLTAAKQSLVEIIEKINADSKKLFAATYESVRGHFQEIFRKLFGGGTADVLLENPDDILESGIEIVARPPGKESRNLSLLSGGEKSLTAVALLLAIFRDKPSPFCIMDEVDAALDEANIGRFAATLREFLDQSQFILVSHSKKTMATADVLYGVTMQEAGVSKRIAVRYEEAAEQPLAKAA